MAARNSTQAVVPAGDRRSLSSRQARPRKNVQEQRLRAVFEVARILASGYSLEEMLPLFLSCLIRTLEAADIGMLLLYAGPGPARHPPAARHGWL